MLSNTIYSIKKAILNGFREHLNLDFYESEISDDEKNFLNKNRSFYSSDEWVYSKDFDPAETKIISEIYKCSGGVFKTFAKIDEKRNLLKNTVEKMKNFSQMMKTIN